MKNPRLNITLEPEYIEMLTDISVKRSQSISAVAKMLILEALELQEDLYFSELAEDVERRTTKWVSHEDAWK
jgi:predicted DNA-binding protein